MRIIIPLIILVLIDIYAFQAFRLMAQNWTVQSRTILFGIYWALSAIALSYIGLSFNGLMPELPKSVQTIFRASVFILYFSKLFVALFLALDDLRRAFSWIYESIIGEGTFNASRSKFLTNLGIMVGAIPFTSLFYGIARNSYRYKIYRQNIQVKNLPDSLENLKIVQISDIHSGSFFLKEPIKNGIEMINNENPDLVFFTGDLVNSLAEEIEPYKDIFSQIKSKHGVYSVFGNHDYGDYARFDQPDGKAQNLNNLAQHQKDLGWNLLRNENRILNINNEKVAIIGIENASAVRHFKTYGDLEKASQGTQNAKLKLLLSHDPSYWKYKILPEFKDIDITFSGHTHGFQFGIEIPGFLKWSPSQYMYKEWAGLYTESEQHLYVNRGFGFLGYPGRIGILPEITVITLKKTANT